MVSIKRGQIWWVDFGIPSGSAPGYRRPVLLIQDDCFNRSRIATASPLSLVRWKWKKAAVILLVCCILILGYHVRLCSETLIPPDRFEPDNDAGHAQIISLNDKSGQEHSFHDAHDVDWVKFFALKNVTYDISIKVEDSGEDCNPAAEVYDEDSITLLKTSDWGITGESEVFTFQHLKDGICYLKIRHAGQNLSGHHTIYSLYIQHLTAPSFPVLITGRIFDDDGNPVTHAIISTDANCSAMTGSNNTYLIIHEPGIFTFTITNESHGYLPMTVSGVLIRQVESITKDFTVIRDSDGDGIGNRFDNCPEISNPDQIDSDKDGAGDLCDLCPNDAGKSHEGICGCGVPDTDSDEDGTPDCIDQCPNDHQKLIPGWCGCGVSDIDEDHDGTPNCKDLCPNDANKIHPGVCGCGVSDADSEKDGIPDCRDMCPSDPNKSEPGVCGCRIPDTDSDADGTPDCLDQCPNDRSKSEPCLCGCGMPDTDSDRDGIPDCKDQIPFCPEPAFPANGYQNVALIPALITNPLTDNFRHARTRWQISLDDQFSILLWDITSDVYLTEISIPALVLDAGTVYYWRVQYLNQDGEKTQWSETFSFNTHLSSEDSNLNGVPDQYDYDIPTDLDENGVWDTDQKTMTCAQTIDGGYVCISSEASIIAFNPLSASAVSTIDFGSKDMPLSVMSFKITFQDKSVRVTIYFSKPIPEDSIWYAFDTIHGWQNFSSYVNFSASRTSLSFDITDGGIGDADGTENRIFVHTGGFEMSQAPLKDQYSLDSTDVGGADCFIGTIFKTWKY